MKFGSWTYDGDQVINKGAIAAECHQEVVYKTISERERVEREEVEIGGGAESFLNLE